MASRCSSPQRNLLKFNTQEAKSWNLFGIVQGGLDPVVRDICVNGLVERNLPGYAIDGLAGGESKDSFWRVVAQCTASLPEDKLHYVMGVGYPLDIVVFSALGIDMYGCVDPIHTAPFGTALYQRYDIVFLHYHIERLCLREGNALFPHSAFDKSKCCDA